ncbi:MAG: tRNA (adenosine(37)-N6)-threonylcarbamoyltransferase complex dimerization subunit type 1 TsaB [Sedimentitalea sp.]
MSPSDPLILAFDTSAAHCAAALLLGDRVLASQTHDMTRGQGEHLMPLLQNMLQDQKLDWADLDLIGVGIGPGNFTGIRISVAAARGLAFGLGVPTIGVSNFEVMRGPNSLHDLDPQIVSLAAPRNAHYLQYFEGGRPVGPPHQVSPNSEDMPDFPPPLPPIRGHNAHDVSSNMTHPGPCIEARMSDVAQTIGKIALAHWRSGERTPPRPAPLYVRAADAAPARDTPPVILD